MGRRKGKEDSRSKVGDTIVTWVESLATRGCLQWFALENSPCQNNKFDDDTSYIQQLTKRFARTIPFFIIDYSVVELSSVHPQHRRRGWLRGVRRDCLAGDSLPPIVMCSSDPAKLDDLLTPYAQHQDVKLLTKKQQTNLAAYLRRIRTDISSGAAGSLAVIDVDRANDGVFAPQLLYGKTATLRTKGPNLFVISTYDLASPVKLRAYFRFLTLGERFKLQGHSDRYAEFFPSKVACRRATGNAYAVPMLAAATLPLIQAVVDSGSFNTAGPSHLNKRQLDDLAKKNIKVKRRRCEASL
jgi:site-specific DNA-cytosine methylase